MRRDRGGREGERERDERRREYVKRERKRAGGEREKERKMVVSRQGTSTPVSDQVNFSLVN